MDEIHRFNEGLKFLNQNLFGTAMLESMEDWISSGEATPCAASDVAVGRRRKD